MLVSQTAYLAGAGVDGLAPPVDAIERRAARHVTIYKRLRVFFLTCTLVIGFSALHARNMHDREGARAVTGVSFLLFLLFVILQKCVKDVVQGPRTRPSGR